MKIVICDTNSAELDWYTAQCRAICERKRVPAVFKTFASGKALLLEMMEPSFSTSVSILVLEPFNGCEMAAEQVRGLGYDGVILYLSKMMDKRYVMQAFDTGAFNFVEKNGTERFESVFDRALQAAKDLERQYIVLRFSGEYRQIDLRDIYYFEGRMNHMVCVWYTGGDFMFRSTLSELEKSLDAKAFVRIQRSYLVALDVILRVTFEQITLINGTTLSVSRDRFAALRETIENRGLH